MSKHPRLRMLDIANALGLVCGAVGLVVAGQELQRYLVELMGWISLIFFGLLLMATIYRWCGDVINLRNEQLKNRKSKK